MEKVKVHFQIESEIKSDIERNRKNYPEKTKTFSSMVKEVIKIKDEPLSNGVTKTIHRKEDTREKKVINSESSKEETLRKSYPLRSRKTESRTVNLATKTSNTFNNTTVYERYK